MTDAVPPVVPAAPAAPPAPPAPPVAEAPAEKKPLSLLDALAARRQALKAALAPAPAATAPVPPVEAPPVEVPPAAPPAEVPPGEEPPPAEEPPPEVPPGEEPPVEPEVPEVDAKLIIALPGRNHEEKPFEIEAPDIATADRLRQLINGYQRAERVRLDRATIDREASELRERRDQIEVDPVGFLRAALPPEDVELMALTLLTDPKVWPNVQETIKLLTDTPDKMELARARLQNLSYERRDVLVQRRDQRRAAEKSAREVKSFIAGLIPEGMEETRGQDFYERALTEVRDFATRTNAETIEQRYLPALIAHVAREFGIDPFAPDAKAPVDGKASPTAPPRRPKVGQAAPVGPPAPAARGEDLAKAAAAKAALAGVPPGSPVTGEPQLPPKQGVKERIAFLRGRR